MILNCPHCANNARYWLCDFYGQWVVCQKCETAFRWREVGGGRDVGRTMRTAVGAAETEIER